MLDVDGYMYLRIDDPMCAWNTYRGVLVSANIITRHPGCVSVWMAASLRRGGSSSRIIRETKLEKIRRLRHPDKVSRCWGVYTFTDKDSADRAPAEMQLPYVTASNLAEISLAEARRSSTHDGNWITYHSDDTGLAWSDGYWSGRECPGHAPLWERLVEGRLNILGTELRERAYGALKKRFPEALCLLEIARIAAWVGSDLGSIAAFLISRGDKVRLDYYLNMEEANDPRFLKKVGDYLSSGLPVNRDDLASQLAAGTFGATPDLRAFSFEKPMTDFA